MPTKGIDLLYLNNYFFTENLNNNNAVTLEEVYLFITNNSNGNDTLKLMNSLKFLEKQAGINLNLSDSDINEEISKYLNETIKDELVETRYILLQRFMLKSES